MLNALAHVAPLASPYPVNYRKGTIMNASPRIPAALVAATLALSTPAIAQTTAAQVADTTAPAARHEATAAAHVTAAVAVARKLEGNERMRPLLRDAKGIFIVPSYRRAAFGVGGAGGAGVLLVRRADGGWSDPVFYQTGGLSLGLQAGVEGGAFALVLNNEKAVQEFLKKNNFSLNAKAGITVTNWNRMAQASGGTGDVLAWADTTGLFGDVLTLELNDIRYSDTLTNAYYHRTLSAGDVVAGKADNPQAGPLLQAVGAAASTAR